ncbi:MAG: hypothetical protein KBT46_00435 [Ruminococcus sp.]|nr:hypothetical protein [Candidatus Copronaster equi]
MKHYLFECIDENDENEGEEFLVGADSYTEAQEIAYNNFGKCKCHGKMTEEEAENSGLDEY